MGEIQGPAGSSAGTPGVPGLPSSACSSRPRGGPSGRGITHPQSHRAGHGTGPGIVSWLLLFRGMGASERRQHAGRWVDNLTNSSTRQMPRASSLQVPPSTGTDQQTKSPNLPLHLAPGRDPPSSKTDRPWPSIHPSILTQLSCAALTPAHHSTRQPTSQPTNPPTIHPYVTHRVIPRYATS